MATLEEEVSGIIYTEGEPLNWWVAVWGSARNESWWDMPLQWRLCCIYTCDFFNVPLERFLGEVGRVRERLRKGEQIWVEELVP